MDNDRLLVESLVLADKSTMHNGYLQYKLQYIRHFLASYPTESDKLLYHGVMYPLRFSGRGTTRPDQVRLAEGA